MQGLEVRVGGLTFYGNTRAGVRPYGLFVKPKGFQGWQGLPAGRREALARAVAHGEFDAPTFLPARVMTLDFWGVARSAYELDHLANQVVGVGASGDRVTVTVALNGRTLTAQGRRLSGEFDDSGNRVDGAHGEGQLQFVFADPRKYGDQAVLPKTGTGTSIPVFHYGNFPAFPVVEIPSAPAAYTVSAGGKTFTVSGATAGGTHEVHLRSGRVYRNGVEMPGVGRGDVWTVPAGAKVTHTLSSAGRVKITDTFV